MRRSLVTGLLIGQFAIGSICAEEGTVIPDGPLGFLAEYCIDCQEKLEREGAFVPEEDEIRFVD